jgi:hypothetical protein
MLTMLSYIESRLPHIGCIIYLLILLEEDISFVQLIPGDESETVFTCKFNPVD